MSIYLDNAATSYPKPECVYDAVVDYMKHNGTSPGRGNYALARDADVLVYQARKSICKLFNAKRPSEIIFTSNATEALNIALKGYLAHGDSVMTTSYEHNAMWRPLKNLEQNRGVKVNAAPVTPEGCIDLDWAEKTLKKGGIKLVALCHASNVTGVITPLKEIACLAKQYGAVVLVDAAQTAGAYPIDLSDTSVDMLAFTGHKSLLGPTGTGGLYLRSGVELKTLKEGGTGGMSMLVSMPDDPPDRYEAGTMNISGIAGLLASVSYLLDTGVESIREHEVGLMRKLIAYCEEIPNLTYYGPKDAKKRVGLISFNIAGKESSMVASELDEKHRIMVRAGLHCAPQAHRLTDTFETGAVRASIGRFTTEDEVEEFASAIKQIAKQVQ